MIQEINQHTLENLLKHMSKEEYVDLVKNFVADARNLLQGISTESFIKDREEVTRNVHTIKGNAISLGFDRLFERSSQMEARLKRMTLNQKSTIFANYLTETDKILNQILEHYNADDRGGF